MKPRKLVQDIARGFKMTLAFPTAIIHSSAVEAVSTVVLMPEHSISTTTMAVLTVL